MLKNFVLLVLYMIPLASFGQSDIDSLMAIAERNTKSVLLQEIGDYYQTDNIDSVKKYSDLLKNIAIKKKDLVLEQLALLKWARALAYFNYSDSAEHLLSGLKLKDSPLLSIEYNLVQGLLNRNNRKYDIALTNFYEALAAISNQSVDRMVPFVYAEIAHILTQNNDLENTKKYHYCPTKVTQKGYGSIGEID